MIVLRCDGLCSVSVVIPLLRIDNSVFLVPFSHVLVLSVRVLPLRDRCQIQDGLHCVHTKSSESYISIRKAARHELFRSFLLLKILCAITMASQSLSRCSSVQHLFADSLVRVDHRRLLVRWKMLNSKWSERLKLEINIPPQQISAKRGDLFLKGA